MGSNTSWEMTIFKLSQSQHRKKRLGGSLKDPDKRSLSYSLLWLLSHPLRLSSPSLVNCWKAKVSLQKDICWGSFSHNYQMVWYWYVFSKESKNSQSLLPHPHPSPPPSIVSSWQPFDLQGPHADSRSFFFFQTYFLGKQPIL